MIRIFIDPKPHREHYNDWLSTIAARLPGVRYETIQTNGLQDGYWRSVRMSEGDYAVQLEHDWMFIKRRIRHSLDEIIDDMQARRINYLRFNKRRNVQFGIDYFLEEDNTGKISTCRISGRSNNPHIIDVTYYRSLLGNPKTVGLEGRYLPVRWRRTPLRMRRLAQNSPASRWAARQAEGQSGPLLLSDPRTRTRPPSGIMIIGPYTARSATII